MYRALHCTQSSLITRKCSGPSSSRLRHGCKNQVMVDLEGKHREQHGASSRQWLSTVRFLRVHQLCANGSAKASPKFIVGSHLSFWSPGLPPRLYGHILLLLLLFVIIIFFSITSCQLRFSFCFVFLLRGQLPPQPAAVLRDSEDIKRNAALYNFITHTHTHTLTHTHGHTRQ